MNNSQGSLSRTEWAIEKIDSAIAMVRGCIRRPAFYAIIGSVLVLAIVSIPNPVSDLFSSNPEWKNLIITLAGTFLGAAIVSLWLDTGKMESRIRKLGSDIVLNDVAKLLSGNIDVLSCLGSDNLRALSQSFLMAKHDLALDSEDIRPLVDICFDEIEPKIHGLYSSHYEVRREVYPVKDDANKVVAWKIQLNISQNMKNASTHPLELSFDEQRTSGAINAGISGKEILTICSYSVEVDGVNKFSLQEPLEIKCTYCDGGRRKWNQCLPIDERIPNVIDSGHLVRYQYTVEFLTPVAERATLNWSSPRKGVRYCVNLHDISDYETVIALNGCSLCEGRRNRACTSCGKRTDVITITGSELCIEDCWTGSDMGLSVEWVKKKD